MVGQYWRRGRTSLDVYVMLGWLPKLVLLMGTIMIVVPTCVWYLGFVNGLLSFVPLFVASALFWRHESKRARERENSTPEVTSEERRAKALEEWIKMHKKED